MIRQTETKTSYFDLSLGFFSHRVGFKSLSNSHVWESDFIRPLDPAINADIQI